MSVSNQSPARRWAVVTTALLVPACSQEQKTARSPAADLPAQVASAGPVGDATFTNSLGMTMVYVRPGGFLMGSPAGETGRQPDEGPQHRVLFADGFHMAAHEVTQGQFKAFVDASEYKTEAERHTEKPETHQYKILTWKSPGYAQSDDHPVACVTWSDARAFCKWLSARESRTYRLPTEAEWEYACRAGASTRFCFGDSEALLDDYAWANRNSPDVNPVGQKRPNAWGLYDMHGGLWEWCQDWYADGYYRESRTVDPKGPPAGTARVLRGGDRLDQPDACRSANRFAAPPRTQGTIIGFRPVCVRQTVKVSQRVTTRRPGP